MLSELKAFLDYVVNSDLYLSSRGLLLNEDLRRLYASQGRALGLNRTLKVSQLRDLGIQEGLVETVYMYNEFLNRTQTLYRIVGQNPDFGAKQWDEMVRRL